MESAASNLSDDCTPDASNDGELYSAVAAMSSACRKARTAFSELGVNWPIVIWISVVHVLALAAPFFFTWPALVTCVFLAFMTGSFGVCMGYHRLLTHKSFQTYRPIKWLLALLGGLSGEGSALTWVAQHRKHHAFSDHEGDPHSPRDGHWWSHMLWFMPNFGKTWHRELLQRYAPDILKDRVMVALHYLFLPSHFICAAMLFVLGYFGPTSWGLGTAWAGWSMVIWGLGVRMVYVLHITWFVNSATHLWGYRNYTKRLTTVATFGGWGCWRGARDGTTTIMPTNEWLDRAIDGGRLT